MYMNIFKPMLVTYSYLLYLYVVSQTSGTGNTSNTTQGTSTFSSKQGIVINPCSVTWAGNISYFAVFVRVCVCLSTSTVSQKWQTVRAPKLELLLFSTQRRTMALS